MTIWNRWVCFSWDLVRNEFAFSVKGLDVVLLIRNDPRYVQSQIHNNTVH